MDHVRLALASLVCLGTLATGPAPAFAQTSNPFAEAPREEVIHGVTPEEMAAILQEIGYRAEIATNNEGKRRIRTRIAGWNVTVHFYSCDAQESCKSIGLRSFFTNEKNRDTTFANRWNQEKRFTKVYIDSDDEVNIEYDFLFRNGVTKGNVKAYFDVFEDQIKEFVAELQK